MATQPRSNHAPVCGCADGPSSRRSDRHDASYCRACRAWLSPVCVDECCEYCKNRPPTAPATEVPDGEASAPVQHD